MAATRSFTEYVKKKFDNNFWAAAESYLEANLDSLGIELKRIHRAGETEISDVKVWHLTVRFVVVIAIVPRFMMTVEFYLFNPLHILIMCANIRLQNIIPHYQKGVLSMAVTVSVTLTDEEYEEVLVKSKAIGLSVAQYVKKYPISVDDFDSRYSYLKEQALLQPAGVPFTVMSLFDDWDTIPRGVKLSLGRNFYHLVKRETQELIQIKPAGKTSSNVQLYVKEG